MKKILTSPWVAAVIGVLAFAGTAFFMFKNEKEKAPSPAGTNQVAGATNEAPATTDHLAPTEIIKPMVDTTPAPSLKDVAEPGMHKFDATDVQELVAELQKEREALRKREQFLNAWAAQLAVERDHLTTITNEVGRVRARVEKALTNSVVIQAESEEKKMKEQARLYGSVNMPASSAVMILDNMPLETTVKILAFMPEKDQAVLLEYWATNSAAKLKLQASDLSGGLLRIVQKKDIPSTK